MGIVRMTEKITGEWEDIYARYQTAEATLYVYCDQCGSFSIKSRIGNRKVFCIITACILLAAGIFSAFQPRYGIYWFFLCLVLCMFAIRYLWGDVNYICNKCGSVPTTSHNTLGYPSDMGILDVPDQFTQKRYQEYCPDYYNLDNALMSPEGLVTDDGVVSLISQDVKRIPRFLLYLLSPILLIIFTISYPIFLILYWLWTVVFSKGKDV